MKSDGGPAYPIHDRATGDFHTGKSVRDEFAMAISKNPHLTQESDPDTVQWIYDFAQMMTDEKLRRDTADRDEPRVNYANAIALLDEWLADNSGYDEATWPALKQAIRADRDEGTEEAELARQGVGYVPKARDKGTAG